MTENVSTKRRVIQNFHLIWFDPTIEQPNDESQKSFINQLQTTFQTIHKFNNEDQCTDFLTRIQYEKVFMIISNSVNEHFISCIHDKPQLDSIYICYREKPINEEWIKNWSKIKGVFQQDTSLVELLKQRARNCDQNSTPISIISPNIQFNQNLDQLDPTFIYTQMLKEILLEIKYDKQSINDLIEHIRTYYLDNEAQLKTISRFEQTYDEKSCIWWYTSEVFIYSILNKALRTLEVDTIIKMGVYIRDLHMNINEKYKEQNNTGKLRTFKVYRGQGMSYDDFKKLQTSKGGLLSFNNFLSTSFDQEFPKILANSSTDDPNLVGILFQMKIDDSFSSAPYADIVKTSKYSSEKEILFSMNTIFRIREIEALDDTDRLWQVNLTITSDTDQDLIALADHLRKETKHTTGWARLVPLLIRLGEFEKAKQLCETLLQTTSDDHEKATIYGQLGYIHDSLSKYTQAISFYKKALKIMCRLVSSDDECVASTYNNIGLAFKNLGEPKNALSFLEKGLEIYGKVLPPGHSYFGVIHNNIGLMHDQLGDQSKALYFYEKSIDLKDTLPNNHPELANIYKNIGGIYKDKADYSKALQFIEKALQIEEKVLPKNHPSFAISYNHMGNIYKNLGDYSQAISFYEKAIEISRKNYGEIHQDMAIGYGNISSAYIKMCEYSKAVLEGEKAIEIGRKIFKEDHIHLATFYNTVGLAYCHLRKYKEAFSHCQRAVSIYEKTSGGDPLDRANAYISIGGIYMVSSKHEQALAFFEKGRNIQERILPPDHLQLANTYTNIGQVYFAMRDHLRALFFSGKGLIIRRKILSQYHPELITSCISVAGPFLALRQRSIAREVYKHAVEIARRSLPIDHPERQACEMMLNLLTVN